ncbi:hypothetical protein BJX99DRAFT_264630 [Aspergillus californicus]
MNFHFLLLVLATTLIQLGGCVEGDTIEKRSVGPFKKDMTITVYDAPACKGTASASRDYKKGTIEVVEAIGFPLAKSFKMSRELLPGEQFDISVPYNMNAWTTGAPGNKHSCEVNIHQYTDKELGLGVNCYDSLVFTCHKFWVHG